MARTRDEREAKDQRVGRRERFGETALAEFVNNIVKQRSGESLSQLTIEQQTAAVPTDAIPQVIADKAREHGVELHSALWAKLDYDQRYVLLKFGSDERRRRKFAAALKEFLADL